MFIIYSKFKNLKIYFSYFFFLNMKMKQVKLTGKNLMLIY